MIFLLSLPLALFAFMLESYPRFINKEYGVDIWTHLLYLKEYHRQKGIPKRIEKGFLVPGDYDYPPAFIWILSKFPFKLVEKYEFFFSPFFYFIHLTIIFGIVYFLTSNIFLALLTQLLYILTPIIILENSSATPRSLGYTLFTILMVYLIFFGQLPNPIFLAISIIAGSLIFLSHRFTTQGFFFFALYFSIVEHSLTPIYVFALSFIIAVFISKGFYLKVLKGHIGNLLFWKDNIGYRFAHQVKGNIRIQENRDFVFKTYNQFLKFPPFVLEITSPWVLIVIYIFLFDFPLDPFMQRLVQWVIITYILALITIWIPKLRFLGEGQRYLELSAFPAAYISAQFLLAKINSPIGFLSIILYSLMGVLALATIFVIQRKAIINERIRTLTSSLKEMFAYLKSLKSHPRLLCIPHQITTSTIYHTDCPVFVNASYATISEISDVYPFMRGRIDEIMDKHKLDMILLNDEYTSLKDLNLRKFQIVKECGSMKLIKPL